MGRDPSPRDVLRDPANGAQRTAPQGFAARQGFAAPSNRIRGEREFRAGFDRTSRRMGLKAGHGVHGAAHRPLHRTSL